MSKIILPNDPEAAELVTIKMWKTSKGQYFHGNNEDLARWNGSTHDTCKCGKVFEKGIYTICPACILAGVKNRYEAFEKVEWYEKYPVTEFDGDKWFYSLDEVEDYCEENECEISSLMLVHSKPIELPTIDIDDFLSNVLPDEGEPPQDLIDAAELFNEAISNSGTLSYTPTFKAVKRT